jgi:hypothetical protein
LQGCGSGFSGFLDPDSESGASGNKQRNLNKYIMNISIHFFYLWQKFSLCSCWPGTWQFLILKTIAILSAPRSETRQTVQTCADIRWKLQTSYNPHFMPNSCSVTFLISILASCKKLIVLKVGFGLSKNAGSGLNYSMDCRFNAADF